MQTHLLADIGKAVIAASTIGFTAQYLRIPLILCYIAAGAILGPHFGIGAIQDANSIANISEIGLVLLMFILGLEINLKKLLQTGKAVLISGSVQILGCILLSGLLFYFLGFKTQNYDLLYLAVACSLSSTLIVVKILSDQMDLDSLPSRITLGILVLQDFFAIGFLALQPNLNNLNPNALFTSFSKVAILVFLSWFLARYVLPFVFKKAGKQPELMLIIAMSWCFGICGVANYLNLSVEMGALVAGVSIASYPYHYDIAAKITSLRDFFITLFFVSLGLQIPVPQSHVLYLTLLIIGFVLISRLITIYPVLHKLGNANRASLLPALNLSQVSEFSLVLAALGVSYQHISADLLSAFILALVFTSLLSSFLIPGAHNIYKFLNPYLERIGFRDQAHSSHHSEDEKNLNLSHPIVILGFYRDASSMLFELQQKFSEEFLNQVLIVDFNPEVHQKLKDLKVHCRYGDISNVDLLRNLRLDQSKLIVCSIPDKILKGITNFKLLLLLKKLAPESQIIVTAESMDYARTLYQEGASYVYIPRLVGGDFLVEILERMQAGGALDIKNESIKTLDNRIEVIP